MYFYFYKKMMIMIWFLLACLCRFKCLTISQGKIYPDGLDFKIKTNSLTLKEGEIEVSI